MIRKGFFKPKNISKYKGNPAQIVFRSSWEFKMMRYLDSNDKIISWSSEEIIVNYFDKATGRYRRYFPDFFVEILNNKNEIEKIMIEVKPKIQTMPPKQNNKKKSKRFLREVLEYATNTSKWDAARDYCKKRGYKFQIITEDDIFA